MLLMLTSLYLRAVEGPINENSNEANEATVDVNPPPRPPLAVKNEVVSEEELLTPQKKDPPKIVASKVSESEVYVQDLKDQFPIGPFKDLTLNDVIEQGMRKNYDKNSRDKKNELTDISLKGASQAFWFPHVKLSLSTDSQLLSLIGNSSRANGTNNPIVPAGVFGLSLGEYTLFNWGKDYAQYRNTVDLLNREKGVYSESTKNQKLDLILSYFTLLNQKNLERIFQDELRHASFIYRLNKEKITVGKTSQQDYYQARNDYLKAQEDYQNAKLKTQDMEEEMAFTIVDNVGTRYVLTEALEYKKIKMSLDEALGLVSKQSPDFLTKKILKNNAERNYDIAQKENLPLPKISLNLGAYNKTFDKNINHTLFETQNGNGNLELVASINATWDLVGDNGFLNSQKLARSRVALELSKIDEERTKHSLNSQITSLYKSLFSMQNQMLVFDAKLPTSQKNFDLILENYLNGKTKYADFHLALFDLIETKLNFENLKLMHLTQKITFLKLLGLEDFPGENLERLAIKTKSKKGN